MNDPWIDFAKRAEASETAGYFEEAPTDERPARAVWFSQADQTLELAQDSTPNVLERTSRRFLNSARGRCILGYLSFDAGGIFEPLVRSAPGRAPFPLGEFALVSNARTSRVPPRRRKWVTAAEGGSSPLLGDSLSQSAFQRSVGRLKHAIRSGEAYQVVLGHRRMWDRPNDLVDRAGRLREIERFAFFYYLQFGDRVVLGASPESVVETVRGRASINPIAGTLPTGESRGRRRPLHKDPKELAEHRMLVDLARNDLGRVSRRGSVGILWKERRLRYARLEHLVTRVSSRLRPGVGPWETLGAAFPAGTVSGAPKIRATHLLRAEERSWRGPYGGAIGCLLPHDESHWALTIRSAFAAGRRLYTAAGAGIVNRSEPRREWLETLVKLRQLETAIVGERGK